MCSLSILTDEIAINHTDRWLLARRPEYRAWLGQMWAIDGLLDGLRSNARLELKEA